MKPLFHPLPMPALIGAYTEHVDGVLGLIHDACDAVVYISHCAPIESGYEITVTKKDKWAPLCDGMVTPRFPVRMHVFCDERGNVRKCVGYLCSPLLKPDGEDAGKRYRMDREVPIGNLQCMTDFLLLHLSFGCAVARYMLYITEAIPKHPQIPTIGIELEVSNGFVFKYNGRCAVLKIERDMSVMLKYQDRKVALPELPSASGAIDTGASVNGGAMKRDEEDGLFEHYFCDIEKRDVIAGKGIKTHHPTTMLLCAAIAETLFFSPLA